MITRQLNPQAIIIEDAETELRVLLWTKYLNGYRKEMIRDSVQRVVNKCVKKLTSKELKSAAAKSLYKFADRMWKFMTDKFGTNGKSVQRTIEFITGQTKQVPKNFAVPIMGTKQKGVDAYYESQEMGVPNNTYMKTYMQEVKRTVDEMANINALDPDDLNGRNSLRNKAEMVARQEYHENEINELKGKGIKLVVCSAHQDCSDRCFKWQGRIYSLDGTSGEVDGKKYIPLETATDVYYTTKSGKRYKNGLLGFNCRHRLYEYQKGMKIPKVSKSVQEKENKVNTKQRQLERDIRFAKTKALMYEKAGQREEYLKWRKKAIELNKKYQEFSMKNGRPYYPDRVTIFD